MKVDKAFAVFASRTAKAAGNPWTFAACLALVLAWAATGPVFGFSETWQLVINTGTTIVTFLMVFLIQNSQNRDAQAMQAKLDELVLVSDAENEFVGIESLTEKELDVLRERCARRAKQHADMHARVSKELDKRSSKRAARSRQGAVRADGGSRPTSKPRTSSARG